MMDRFWSKVNTEAPGGCWEWTAAKLKTGYGRFKFSGKPALAHRVSYELVYGEFDKTKQVIHSCDNPSCVKPDHLRLGTIQENMQDRGDRGRHGRYNSKKTQCKNGHPFSGDNLHINANGSRSCKECGRAWSLARYHRKKLTEN